MNRMIENDEGQRAELAFGVLNDAVSAHVQNVSRVLVAGAGISGLTVANALMTAGVEVVVLEARTRVGGRIHTVTLQDGKADAGASWIHQPDDNPLIALARASNIRCKPFALTTIFSSMRLVDIDGTVLDDPERDRVLALAGELADEVVEAASAAEAVASIEALVDDALEREGSDCTWAGHLLRLWFETDLAAPLADIAPNNLQSDEAGEDEDGDDVLDDGYFALLPPLSADLSIRTASVITRIVSDANGVTVHCADGHLEYGSHVVVTVPLGVLKADAISFEPALEPGKRTAIDRLGFGRFEKLILQFETRFWATELEISGFVIKDEPIFGYWIDLTAINGKPTLVAHMAGPAAERLAAMGTDAALTAAYEALRRATNAEIPAPTAIHLTNWSGDPHARGSYMHYAPLSSPADVAALAAPHHMRVLFAGEATVPDRYGYVDGAFSSGLREAGRLLELKRVTLSLRLSNE